MRILITGARDWDSPELVRAVIDRSRKQAWGRVEDLYVRHGKCHAGGADIHAQAYVRYLRSVGCNWIHDEPRPAQWQHPNCTHAKGIRRGGQWYCKAAGPLRNQAMLDEGGIDEVHGFPMSVTGGTADCMRRAHRLGLRVFSHGDVTLEEILNA